VICSDDPKRQAWELPRLPEEIEAALAAFIAENEPPIAIAAAHGWRYQGKPGDKLIDLRRAIDAAVNRDLADCDVVASGTVQDLIARATLVERDRDALADRAARLERQLNHPEPPYPYFWRREIQRTKTRLHRLMNVINKELGPNLRAWKHKFKSTRGTVSPLMKERDDLKRRLEEADTDRNHLEELLKEAEQDRDRLLRVLHHVRFTDRLQAELDADEEQRAALRGGKP